MTVRYSPQQLAVFAAVEQYNGGSLTVESVAGSGKTTVLVGACERMRPVGKWFSVALIAYNKAIAEELKAKVAHLKYVKAGTVHSFGFQAWRRMAPNAKVEGKKLQHLQELALEAEGRADEGLTEVHEFVRTLVSLAKQQAFGCAGRPLDQEDWYRLIEHYDVAEVLPETVTADQLAAYVRDAQALLALSNAQCSTVIDYDDMIYAPLFFNARVWQNDWVLVDEAQDTNPARRMLARKMLRPGGRLIAVGDPHQAIYGFTGADSDALDLISRDFNCRRMPLTVTYRCPKAVVEVARQWVSHITAADSAPEGVVRALNAADIRDWRGVFSAGDAVLCRNTAPLIDLAFKLIRNGVGCRVEGREIGNGLIALATRWKRLKTLGALADKLAEYREREVQKLMAKGQELKAAAVEDRVEALLALIDGQNAQTGDVASLVATIKSMFGDSEPGAPVSVVVLSTVHKSKGREWDRVYLVNRETLMPSRYARQAWQLEQEYNLMYVAVTRAKRELIELTLPSAATTTRRAPVAA
jgi:DNA helicase-2/ATP-dependent DNA helicase PcrA